MIYHSNVSHRSHRSHRFFIMSHRNHGNHRNSILSDDTFMFYLRHSESALSRCFREKINLCSQKQSSHGSDCHLKEFYCFLSVNICVICVPLIFPLFLLFLTPKGMSVAMQSVGLIRPDSVTSVTSFWKFLYNKYIHLQPNVFLYRKFCILITLITQI